MPTATGFELIALPYAQDALAPVISAETLAFHHGKHHQTYVNNLNGLLPGSGLEGLPLEEIVKKSTGAIFNNAGQILNHNLYFTQFCPPHDSHAPIGTLAEAIKRQFGDMATFCKEFETKGVTLFGSGWVWLSTDKEGTLAISQEPNAGNPMTQGRTPLLTFDVWEHAYYLDWQNRRPAHLEALWQIVDWNVVEERYVGR